MLTASEFWLILGMIVVTFSMRFPVLLLTGRTDLPARLKRALRYVPVTVLTAITAPMLLKPDGHWDVSLDNPYLVAGLVSILVAAISRKLLLTIVIGMSVFVYLKFF